MTQVGGDGVVLRGVRPDEVDAVLPRVAGAELAAGDDAGVARKRARLERSGERTEFEIWFFVETQGRLIGDIQARNAEFAMPRGVWELGIELWDEAQRGRGYGRISCALLTSFLFEHHGATRIQATTDVENAAMRGTLASLGFALEGTLRGFMPQAAGDPRDYVMYGLTKADWLEGKET